MNLSITNDQTWNECFNAVEKDLKKNPIHYRNQTNAEGPVTFKEICEAAKCTYPELDAEDTLDQLIDLVAWIIDHKGYTIIKK